MPYIEFVSKHKSENFDVQFDDRGTSRLLYTAIKNKSVMPLKSTYCAAQHGSYALDPYGYIYMGVSKVLVSLNPALVNIMGHKLNGML